MAGGCGWLRAGDGLAPADMEAAIRSDELSIPSAGECFAAINKLDRPTWSQLVRVPVPPTTTNRAALALHLGTRVADGFIAVEAQDSQRVKNIGRDIINLAKSLGVSQSIIARGSSINDFAENNEWNALREELDATENEVKLAMRGQQDHDLVVLVTVGAWMRGTQAASQVVRANFSPVSASLLDHPAVVEILTSQIDALPQRVKSDSVVTATRDGLARIRESMDTPEADELSEESVVEIADISTQIVEAIAPLPTPAPQS